MLCKVTYQDEIRRPFGKLYPTAFDGIYMGVHSTTQSRVYNPKHKRVEIHTNVKVFDGRKATHLLKDLKSDPAMAATVQPMTLVDPKQKNFEGEDAICLDGQADDANETSNGQIGQNVGNPEIGSARPVGSSPEWYEISAGTA